MSIEFAYESKMLWARQFAACLPPGQIRCLPRTLSSLSPFPRHQRSLRSCRKIKSPVAHQKRRPAMLARSLVGTS